MTQLPIVVQFNWVWLMRHFPRLILLLWVVGALLALAGAVCYSELGTALPMVGGEYIYLRHAYSPFLGFLSGWASFTVGFGAAIAAGAVSFSSYLLQLISPDIEPWMVSKVLAIGLVWTFTSVHVAGVGPEGLVQQILIVLRYRNPQLPRPYRVPLYPFVPALYIMVSVTIVVYTGMERPTESAWAMATVLMGIPLYFLWRPAHLDDRSA